MEMVFFRRNCSDPLGRNGWVSPILCSYTDGFRCGCGYRCSRRDACANCERFMASLPEEKNFDSAPWACFLPVILEHWIYLEQIFVGDEIGIRRAPLILAPIPKHTNPPFWTPSLLGDPLPRFYFSSRPGDAWCVTFKVYLLSGTFPDPAFEPCNPFRSFRNLTFFRVLGIIREFHRNCPVPIWYLFFGEEIRIRWDLSISCSQRLTESAILFRFRLVIVERIDYDFLLIPVKEFTEWEQAKEQNKSPD